MSASSSHSPDPRSPGVARDGADDASVEPTNRRSGGARRGYRSRSTPSRKRSPATSGPPAMCCAPSCSPSPPCCWSPGDVVARRGPVAGVDLVQRLSFITPTVGRIIAGVLTLLMLVAVTAAWAVPLLIRRYRLFGYLLVGIILVSLLLRGVEWFLDRGAPDSLMREVAQRTGVDSSLTVYGLAQTATSFVVLAPFVSRRWRRAGAVLLAVVTLLRLLVPITLPATVAVALGLGAAAGSGTLLMFGRPSGRPTRTAIVAALTSSGLPVARLVPAAVDARGSTPYFATLTDGSRLFVKALGRDERAADLLFRIYRFIRLKNVGDERPFSSLRRTVEHEGAGGAEGPRLGRARPDCVRTSPRWVPTRCCWPTTLIEGTSLDRFARRGRRRPSSSRSGSRWPSCAGTASPIATCAGPTSSADRRRAALDHRLRVQRAGRQSALLEPTWPSCSPPPPSSSGPSPPSARHRRPRKGAGRRLAGQLAAQPFSGATRDALKEQKGLIGQVQSRGRPGGASRSPARAPGPGAPQDDLHRPDPGRRHLRAHPPADRRAGMVARCATPTGDGCRPSCSCRSSPTSAPAEHCRIRSHPAAPAADARHPGRLLLRQPLTPAGVGGIGLNVRYLQKSGADVAVATSGVGLNTVGGLVVHAFRCSCSPSGRAGRPSTPSDCPARRSSCGAPWRCSPWPPSCSPFRRSAGPSSRGCARCSGGRLGGVAHALRNPGKLVLLLGGSAMLTLSYIVCLYLCTRALGGDLSLATVGAVYLLGAAVAAAAPDPGRPRRPGGCGHRGSGRRGNAPHHRRPGRLPLPPRDLLAPHTPRLGGLHLAAPVGVRLATW